MSDILAAVPGNNISKDITINKDGTALKFSGIFYAFYNYGGGYQWGTEGIWHVSRGGVDLPLQGLNGSPDHGYFFINGAPNNSTPTPFDFTLPFISDTIAEGDVIHFETINTYWAALQQRFNKLQIDVVG